MNRVSFPDTEKMPLEQLVAYVKRRVEENGNDKVFAANPEFECSFKMGSRFYATREQVMASLQKDSYDCCVEMRFCTCPVTGEFPFLTVKKRNEKR